MTNITEQGLTEIYILGLKVSLASYWSLELLRPPPVPQNFLNVTKMGSATGIHHTDCAKHCIFRAVVWNATHTVCWIQITGLATLSFCSCFH